MTQSPEPVDTFQLLKAHPDDPPNIRMLRFAVIGMGALLLAGVAAVVGRIAYLATRPVATAISTTVTGAVAPSSAGLATTASGPIATEVRLALPPGAKVRSQSLNGNRLAVHYEAPAGDGILILDLETGRPISQVRIEPSSQ